MNLLKNNVENIINVLKVQDQGKGLEGNISELYKCHLCKHILKGPYQTDCGCTFCKECIESWLRNHKYCPGSYEECKSTDITSNKALKEDKARAKEILRLKVKCAYDGCNVMLTLNELNDHLDSCEYERVHCNLCKEDVIKKNINSHKENECVERKVLFNNYVGTKECSNIYKNQKSCDHEAKFCLFERFGSSEFKLIESKVERDFVDNLYTHTLMMITYIRDRESKAEKLKERIDELDQQMRTLGNEIKLVEQSCNNDDVIVESLLRSDILADNDDDIIWRDGTFLWKIEDFLNIKNDATSGKKLFMFSEPFYSSDFGYKLCLKMYPNGDGIGQGSHISLFVVLMKGKYDNILKWPFCFRIKLSLVSFSKSNVDNSEILKPDPSSQCYVQPLAHCNIGAGSPKFFAHRNLNKDFMLNNTIFIKVSILS